MAFLYINNKGMPHSKHSYSAGLDFDNCAFKYYQRRIVGWKERDNKARMLFGKCLESAVQFYHEHNADLDSAIEVFKAAWSVYLDQTDIEYTKVEKDWQTLLLDGTEMLQLYAIRQPSLPIPIGGKSVFQREYSKEVFPGDPVYGGIEFAGKLDIVCYTDPSHPLLAKLDWKPEYGAYRPLVVDIKTSGKDFPEPPGIAAYDIQLRHYSWLADIRDVALLVFVKKGRGLKKGSSISLLENAGQFVAGSEAVIAKIGPEGIWLVYNDFMLEEMTRAQGEKNGKTDQTNVAKERAMAWLKQNGVLVPEKSLTRQRLQFNSGFVTVDSANDVGLIPARQIVQIVNCWKSNKWPNTFGIRFPKDDSNDPYFRAFVLNDEAYKNQKFVKSDQATFDDLFEDEGVESEHD